MKPKRSQIGEGISFGGEVPVPVSTDNTKQMGRPGRRMLPFWVPLAAHKQLRLMAVDLDKTQQELLTTALNDFFKLHGKPPIA